MVRSYPRRTRCYRTLRLFLRRDETSAMMPRAPSFANFEAKLGNPSATYFAPKQAARCRRVSPHRLHPPIGFEAQTDKPPLSLVLRPKPRTRRSDFEAQITKPEPSVLRPNRETHAVVLRPKPPNRCLSSPPCVRCGSHTASSGFPIVRPLRLPLVP